MPNSGFSVYFFCGLEPHHIVALGLFLRSEKHNPGRRIGKLGQELMPSPLHNGEFKGVVNISVPDDVPAGTVADLVRHLTSNGEKSVVMSIKPKD